MQTKFLLAVVALTAIAAGLLFGPAGLRPEPQSAEGVIQHFAPSGAPPYDVRFDRGPQISANAWNMTAPDGIIDLPNDILGVILQFGHRC